MGADCAANRNCSGAGALDWPAFSAAFQPSDWDALYGPNLGGQYTSLGGLMNTSALYGFSGDGGATLARCVCGPGFTGAFCAAACPACGAHGVCVANATGGARCACSATDPNAKTTVRCSACASRALAC